MKYFAVFVLFAGLAIPVFAQNTALAKRLNALNDAMSTSISRSTETLADFDSQIKDKGETNVYTSYSKQYTFLLESLQESEQRFDLLIRTNDRNVNIEAERDNYEDLLQQLQSVKSKFDTYMKSR
jgi:hypothetical protein